MANKQSKCEAYLENFWLSIGVILVIIGFISTVIIGWNWIASKVEAKEVAEERLEQMERDIENNERFIQRVEDRAVYMRRKIEKINDAYCVNFSAGTCYEYEIER